MTLTTAIISYYAIGTPLLILLMFMISYSSKDQKTRNYTEVVDNAHRKLTVKK